MNIGTGPKSKRIILINFYGQLGGQNWGHSSTLVPTDIYQSNLNLP